VRILAKKPGMARLGLSLSAVALVASLGAHGVSTAGALTFDATCTVSPSPSSLSGAALDAATPTRNGVAYDGTSASLGLARAAGNFKPAQFSIADPIEIACAGDFDEDGWTDFVGGTGNGEAGGGVSAIKFYKNRTMDEPAPQKWTNDAIDCTAAANLPPSTFTKCVRKPKFVATRLSQGTASTADDKHIEEGKKNPTTSVQNVGGAMACADFNRDGHMDFVYLRCVGTTESCGPGSGVRADMFLGKGPDQHGLPSFQAKYQLITDLNKLPNIRGPSNRIGVGDLNGDGYPDLVIGGGSSTTSGSKGQLVRLLNGKGAAPKFDTTAVLVSGVATGAEGYSGVALGDVTGDGVLDIVAGGEGLPVAHLYTQLLGSGLATRYDMTAPAPAGSAHSGALSMTLVVDLDGDGKLDAFGAADNQTGSSGGNSYVWSNSGAAPNPFAAAPQLPTTRSTGSTPPNIDFDGGFFMDYDRDPDGTKDLIVMDDDSGNYKVIANTVVTRYAPCGDVTSGALDVGGAAEVMVTEVRLRPTITAPPGTSFELQASNDDGVNWTDAPPCAGGTTDYCASFSTTVGARIRWRAFLYSNASGSCAAAPGLVTPRLGGMQVSHTKISAALLFRAGPVAEGNLVYVGGSRQPGAAGELFALDDESLSMASPRSWAAAARLDALADSARRIWFGSSSSVRYAFDTASAPNNAVRAALSAPDAASAVALVSWVRGKRFGLGTPRRLGAIESSTAAVLAPPDLPPYYGRSGTTTADRAIIDAFVAANAARPRLVLVGSRDGMLHAFYSNPASFSDPLNGQEVWAFVPYLVARNLYAECTASSTATPRVCAAGNGNAGIATYPDGSPTLADVRIGAEMRTVLVMGMGNGGEGVFALDVTSTFDPATGGVAGPTPLWHFTDGNMGRSLSKPAVIRVRKAAAPRGGGNGNGNGGAAIDDDEQWLAVFASGPRSGADVGDSVYAIDIATGALAWQFDLGATGTYISTAITAYETDDPDQAGTPVVDGFVDRLVFADNKGQVWKLDPATVATTGAALGDVTGLAGVSRKALFSTHLTRGALGSERAIGGTIAVASDGSGRTVLYFGTGGTDDTTASAQNEFYAVYADTGALRHKLTPAAGVRYHGGVTVIGDQVLVSSSLDLSGTGLCASTAGRLQVLDTSTLTETVAVATSSKMTAPVFAREGQIYTVTARGEVASSTFKSHQGGASGGAGVGGGAGGAGGGSDGGEGGAGAPPLDVLGWREVEN
jgi:hypothetical protein